jgi:hypothetical protein
MKLSKAQLKQLITEARSGMLGGIGFGTRSNQAQDTGFVQEASWEDNPDPYGGAEGDLDMGWDNLIVAYRSAIWEAMELGLTPNEIKTAFEEAYDYAVETYTPK